MKKISTLVVLALVVALGSYATADHHEEAEGQHADGHSHSKWFDAPNCDICKPWTAHPDLMMSTDWETHTIENGMVMVSVVPKDKLETYNAVCKQMDATIEKMKTGQHQPKGLCGFCEAMGGLVMAGAKVEKVETAFGNITLVTADNAEAVKKIHEVAKRTQEEAKKMAAMMKQTS